MQKVNCNIEFEEYRYDELNAEDRELIDRAVRFGKNAYAPYSHFKVGAALKLENGEVIGGCNQENAAYPSGLCAERVALFSAATQYPDITPVAMAIVGCRDGEPTEEPLSPCGACLQVIHETELRYRRPVSLFLCGKERIIKVTSVRSLLPFAFDAKNMNK